MSNYPPYNYQPNQPQFGPYPPVQPYPARMDVQPQPQPQQPAQATQVTVLGLSPASRPVTSREEANGVPADFSGAPMIFPDVANDRIYKKQWDLNVGGPTFREYAPVFPAHAEAPQPQPTQQPQVMWASIQDLQDLQDLVEKLQGEVDRLKKPAGKAAAKNESDAK